MVLTRGVLLQERMEFLKEDLTHLFDEQGIDQSQYDDVVRPCIGNSACTTSGLDISPLITSSHADSLCSLPCANKIILEAAG